MVMATFSCVAQKAESGAHDEIPSLKSQKVMKLSSLHFHLSIFVIEKRLSDSASQGVAERKKTASKSSFRTQRSSFPLRNLRKKARM